MGAESGKLKDGARTSKLEIYGKGLKVFSQPPNVGKMGGESGLRSHDPQPHIVVHLEQLAI